MNLFLMKRKDDVDEVNEVLAYLYDRKMIKSDEREGQVWIEVKGRGSSKIETFCRFDSQLSGIILDGHEKLLVFKEKSTGRKGLVEKNQNLGDRMYRKGEVLRSEALSQSNYLNVIRFLEDAELITAIVKKKKVKRKKFLML